MWRRDVRGTEHGRSTACAVSRLLTCPMIPYPFTRFSLSRVSDRAPVTSRVRDAPPPGRTDPVRGVRDNASMRISARADYAVRAALQLAAAQDAGPLKAEAIAEVQGISHKFLEGILGDMRKGGLVQSQRGGNGGYWLARPAESISVADVIRCVEGPLVSVRGERPPDLAYTGPAESLLPLWIALRASVREVLGVSLAEVAAAEL